MKVMINSTYKVGWKEWGTNLPYKSSPRNVIIPIILATTIGICKTIYSIVVKINFGIQTPQSYEDIKPTPDSQSPTRTASP